MVDLLGLPARTAARQRAQLDAACAAPESPTQIPRSVESENNDQVSRANLAVLAVIAAGMLPVTAAQAQYYGGTTQPAPLYPYAVQNSYGVQADQPYAVEVAPNTYVIQRTAPARAYPYVRGQSGRASNPAPEQSAPRFDRPHKPVDHALIEELRKRTRSSARSSTPRRSCAIRRSWSRPSAWSTIRRA